MCSTEESESNWYDAAVSQTYTIWERKNGNSPWQPFHWYIYVLKKEDSIPLNRYQFSRASCGVNVSTHCDSNL